MARPGFMDWSSSEGFLQEKLPTSTMAVLSWESSPCLKASELPDQVIYPRIPGRSSNMDLRGCGEDQRGMQYRGYDCLFQLRHADGLRDDVALILT